MITQHPPGKWIIAIWRGKGRKKKGQAAAVAADFGRRPGERGN